MSPFAFNNFRNDAFFWHSGCVYRTISVSGDYPIVNVGFQSTMLIVALGFGTKKMFKNVAVTFY